MSKSIASYPESERSAVVERRLRNETGGIGYWSAKDYKAAKAAKEKAAKDKAAESA